jgi:xanthine dehydrogenase accessory factor
VKIWRRLSDWAAEHGAAAMVSVHRVMGSAPREEGARLVMRPDGAFHGTIGGGRLEWEALAAARQALAAGRGSTRFVDQALGPDLGQCCGGHVTLLIETFDRRDGEELERLAKAEEEGAFEIECWLDDGRVERAQPSPLSGGGWPAACPRQAVPPPQREGSWREHYGETPTPLLLFGAGHVGRALALALAPLPFAIRWIDSRAEAFPPHIPANASLVRTDDPAAEIAAAPSGAFALVMTHDHALDLAVTAAALRRLDLPFVGLIGSATKRARFEKRFRELGIAQGRIQELVCPIGLPSIAGREPAVIAASAAAQLLQARTALAHGADVETGQREAS